MSELGHVGGFTKDLQAQAAQQIQNPVTPQPVATPAFAPNVAPVPAVQPQPAFAPYPPQPIYPQAPMYPQMPPMPQIPQIPQMPQAPMYPQQPQGNNFQYLANMVQQNINQMLKDLVNSGEIQLVESNAIAQGLNSNPANWAAFLDKCCSPYVGISGLNYNTVLETAKNLLVREAYKMRQRAAVQASQYAATVNPAFGQYGYPQYDPQYAQAVDRYNQYVNAANLTNSVSGILQRQQQLLNGQSAYGGYGGQPILPVNAPVTGNIGYRHQNESLNIMERIYGLQGQSQTLDSYNSDRPQPLSDPTPIKTAMTEAIPARYDQQAYQQPQHTGKTEELPIEFRRNDDYTARTWEKTEPDELEEKLDDEVKYLTSYLVTYNDISVKQENYRLKYPIQSLQGAVTDVMSANPGIGDDPKFMHRIVADSLLYCNHELYLHGKGVIDQCVAIMKKANESANPNSGIMAVREIISVLKKSGSNLRIVVANLLRAFNQAASVNFIKDNGANTHLRLDPITNLDDLDGFLIDNGDPNAELWKRDKIAFSKALEACLNASFYRFFSEDKMHYVDPENLHEAAIIAADENAMIRYSDGTSGRLTFVGDDAEVKLRTEELKKFLKNKTFAVKYEQQIVFHDLNLIDIHHNDHGLHYLKPSYETQIVSDLLEKYGTFLMIDICDSTQFADPLIVGRTYEGDVVVRRTSAGID